MLDFGAHVHCINGLFFVAKTEGKIRMIVDARPVNEYFREPPSSEYASGASFASLRAPRSEMLLLPNMMLRISFIDYVFLPI